jgi:hypothetical protein
VFVVALIDLMLIVPFRFFVVSRWQHTLVLDLAGSLSDRDANLLFRNEQGGDRTWFPRLLPHKSSFWQLRYS